MINIEINDHGLTIVDDGTPIKVLSIANAIDYLERQLEKTDDSRVKFPYSLDEADELLGSDPESFAETLLNRHAELEERTKHEDESSVFTDVARTPVPESVDKKPTALVFKHFCVDFSSTDVKPETLLECVIDTNNVPFDGGDIFTVADERSVIALRPELTGIWWTCILVNHSRGRSVIAPGETFEYAVTSSGVLEILRFISK